MRLSSLVEGVTASGRGNIVSIKNSLAKDLARNLPSLGFREPEIRPAETVTDDAMIYVEAGNNNLMPNSQIIVITIEDDDRIRIQLPSGTSRTQGEHLADILDIDDFYVVGSLGEAIARLRNIKHKADLLGVQNGDQRSDLTVGNIGESE
jgi:hypothetical protein